MISVGQLLEKDYAVILKHKSCTIYDPSRAEIILVGMMSINFPLEWNQSCDHAFVANMDETILWHRRFGHVNYSSLTKMSSLEYMCHLPLVQKLQGICEKGKQIRKPFPLSS